MPDTLADIERRAIEAAIERHDGDVDRAAEELQVGRATIYRRRAAWRILDRARLPGLARARGVTEDEVLAVLGDIQKQELGARIGMSPGTGQRRTHEAARILGVRQTRHGLMLAPDREAVAEELERMALQIRLETPVCVDELPAKPTGTPSAGGG